MRITACADCGSENIETIEVTPHLECGGNGCQKCDDRGYLTEDQVDEIIRQDRERIKEHNERIKAIEQRIEAAESKKTDSALGGREATPS